MIENEKNDSSLRKNEGMYLPLVAEIKSKSYNV
jgi:hypothetical protein